MEKLKVAIIGMGNVGKAALEAALMEPDMQVAGIVRRKADVKTIGGVPVVDHIAELGAVDVAILTVPSRNVEQYAVPLLEKGICTVDSFDIHTKIVELRKTLSAAAVKGGAAAVIAAGWDPGSDSVVRALLMACAPRGITHTNFGPGMSMGHSVAAKAVAGVADALSMTIPIGTGVHRRLVYVALEQGADFAKVAQAIKQDDYFAHDETIVTRVDDINALKSMAHGVNLVRSGVSGETHNQRFEFNMTIDNPGLTAQLMVSCARAAKRQASGCYTMIELPMVDLLAGGREKLIQELV